MSRPRRARLGVLVAVVVVAVAALAGCSGGGSGSSAEIARLRAAAALDRCPTTSPSAHNDLPDVTLGCLGAGPQVAMSQLQGTPTLVNVWATWCGPCQREVPALQQVYAAAGGRLHILGVDDEDSHASALDFAAHAHMKYPSVVDDDGAFLRAIGRTATPTTVFLDADGTVVHTQYGQFHGLDDIKAQVRRYLGVSL